MRENPYKAPAEAGAKADEDVPRWAVATMICLGLLVTVPGALAILLMICNWLWRQIP